ncbi:hypothetical protein BDV26DRAFT_272918 [Aspergillus bertholletiae]|uniref:Uncharacterized protein n=1 Tax=Aspergillus bertholletiae TaxID=1226010 RepID=A0A5N7AT76_9EURO|nr:hypothetical protein BDV26DRAFT_272918 [Aspergillus bertholletiae]
MQIVRRRTSTTAVPAHAAQMPNVTTRGNRKGWLPASLRRPYLLSLSGILLLLAVTIEILRQYSNRHNGIVQYKRKEDLSSTAWRAYTDTPTIFAVLVMVLWEICAQDILRLEPYFQLARPHDVPASVLFINYAFDVAILAPIRAARNRHWIVLCVSFMSLLIRILLPSLLSGLFVLVAITSVETKPLDTWPSLVNLGIQESWFSTEAAYSHMQTVPVGDHPGSYLPLRYTTAPVSTPADDGNRISLTLNQSVYWSNMTCADVALTGAVPNTSLGAGSPTYLINHRESSWSLHNITIPEVDTASDCHISIQLDSLVPFVDGRFQARYWEPVRQSSANSSSLSVFNVNNCPSVGLFGVLVDLENTAETLLYSNVTVFACHPTYQRAIANVSLTWNSSISSAEIVPSTVQELGHKEFSIDGLQRLMSSKRTVLGDEEIFGGPVADKMPINSSRVIGRSRIAVIGDSDILRLSQYQEMIGRLWNDEFITAINRLFDPVAGVLPIDAEQVTAAVALTVVSQAAIILETILLLAFFLLLCLSYIYPRRCNILHGNPSSLAAQCACIARLISPETLLALSHPGYHLTKTRNLRKWAKAYWCLWRDRPKGRQIEITSQDGYHVGACSPPASSGRRDPMPHFLTIPWFTIECILLIGTVAIFGLAFRYMQFQNIKSFTSIEVDISAIFLIYGPAVLSSIIRALFASIHRHLSITEPWIRLRNGKVSSKRLFTPSYGFPSPVVLSLRSGSRAPASIFSLSIICLLNLALIVVSGGLFEPQLNNYYTSTPGLTTSYNSSMLSSQGLRMDFEGYDSAVFTLTMSPSFTTWTTTDFSFLPLATNEPDGSIGVLYTAVTRGIGAYLNCRVMPHSQAFTDRESWTVNWTYTSFHDSENIRCTVQMPLDLDNGHIGQGTIHYLWPENGDPRCQRLTFVVLASWVNKGPVILDEHNFTALQCEPKVDIRDFHIYFNPYGVVQQYESVVGSSITGGQLFKNASDTLEDFNQGLGDFVQYLHSHEHLAFYQSAFPGYTTAQAYHRMEHNPTEFDHDTFMQAVQSIYQATFANYLTLRRDLFFNRLSPDTAVPVNGTTMYTLWGFMPSNTSMVIIISLISIDVLALMAVFLLYHGRYDGPRIPKSLGSLIPWVAQSRMLQEIEKTYDMNEKEREAFQQEDQQYHFRPYTRADGEKMWVFDYDEREGTELALRTTSHRGDDDTPNTT